MPTTTSAAASYCPQMTTSHQLHRLAEFAGCPAEALLHIAA